jgi:hypothetical protein
MLQKRDILDELTMFKVITERFVEDFLEVDVAIDGMFLSGKRVALVTLETLQLKVA